MASPLRNASLRNLFLIWAAWAVIILGYQTLVDERYQPARPDDVLEWTADWTNIDSHEGNAYLTNPFMNRQVSMDSEYYLSIAVAGYEDPAGRFARTPSGRRLPLNYAFFPLYPSVMGALSAPLVVLGLDPVATATLAGVIVSLLGTLGAAFALYDLTRDELEEAGGIRTAFYLLIFPSAFFLAQVFTEGLFAGLAFGSLALIHRKRFLLAGILAALAAWTRSIGLLLVVPLGLVWLQGAWAAWQSGSDKPVIDRFRPYLPYVLTALAVLLPVGAYLIWQAAFGRQFSLVEENWFGRHLFDFERMRDGWEFSFESILSGEVSSRRIYFLLELAAVVLAIIACLFTLRRYPGVALFGLLALTLGLTSGAPQSLIRYVLTVPSLFIFLGRLGRNTAFDRSWTLGSVLLLGMLTALYTYDMWVA